jgi:hypothetical protein
MFKMFKLLSEKILMSSLSALDIPAPLAFCDSDVEAASADENLSTRCALRSKKPRSVAVATGRAVRPRGVDHDVLRASENKFALAQSRPYPTGKLYSKSPQRGAIRTRVWSSYGRHNKPVFIRTQMGALQTEESLGNRTAKPTRYRITPFGTDKEHSSLLAIPPILTPQKITTPPLPSMSPDGYVINVI